MSQAVTTLFEKLGGHTAVAAVVDEFYRRIMDDAQLRPLFANTEMDRQKDHQRKFLTMALGGPNRYSGRSMKKAHQGLGITAHQFGLVAGHLVGTLQWAGVSAPDIDEVVALVAPLKKDVVEA